MFFFFRFGHFSLSYVTSSIPVSVIYSRPNIGISHVVSQFIVTNLEKFSISLGQESHNNYNCYQIFTELRLGRDSNP